MSRRKARQSASQSSPDISQIFAPSCICIIRDHSATSDGSTKRRRSAMFSGEAQRVEGHASLNTPIPLATGSGPPPLRPAPSPQDRPIMEGQLIVVADVRPAKEAHIRCLLSWRSDQPADGEGSAADLSALSVEHQIRFIAPVLEPQAPRFRAPRLKPDDRPPPASRSSVSDLRREHHAFGYRLRREFWHQGPPPQKRGKAVLAQVAIRTACRTAPPPMTESSPPRSAPADTPGTPQSPSPAWSPPARRHPGPAAQEFSGYISAQVSDCISDGKYRSGLRKIVRQPLCCPSAF